MNNFCYWQEDPPFLNISSPILIKQKICLLRQNEYKILKDSEIGKELIKKIDIFCPYTTVEQANECNDYVLSKGIKWDKS